MTKGNSRSQLLAGLAMAGMTFSLAPSAFAQGTTRIEYMQWTDMAIATQTAPAAIIVPKLRGPTAEWDIEPVQGTSYVRIRNKAQPTRYLNNENGALESGPIQPGWYSAMWTIKSMTTIYGWRICNRWTDGCLQVNDSGALTLGPLSADQPNAAWALPGYGTPEKAGVSRIPDPPASSASSTAARSRPSDTVSQAIGSGIATLSSTGALDYRIYLDYCHSNLDDTDTVNTVTAEFWSDRSGLLGEQSVRGLSACSPLGAVVSIEQPFVLRGASDLVDYIKVKIDGGDAVFIDEISLSKGTENRILHEGRDNGNGWCLSTDANDATGTWAGVSAGGSCRSEWSFRLKR